MVSRDTAKLAVGQQVAGRYLLLSVPQLLMGWWVYANGTTLGNESSGANVSLQLLDVRVWLACAEMRERRLFLEEGRTPHYRLSELQRLVGGGLPRLRASVRRLRAVGLIRWDGVTLELASSPEELKVQDLSGFWETLTLIENRARRVPVPRRMVRFMAGGATKVEIGTLLAHLLRCCYRQRGGRVTSIGNCCSAWVEDVFMVNASSVKEARARLMRRGLLTQVKQEQWHRNRYGARVEVNLQWETNSAGANLPRGACADGTESRPLEAVIHNETPTAIETVSLPTEGSKNQPSGGAPETPTGVFQRVGGKHEQSETGKGRTSRPTLKHVLVEDLASIERLETLHSEATTLGLAPKGERGVLEFVSLATHAYRYGTKNPPGLFARLLRDQKWHFITQDDEDAARARLREHERRVPPSSIDQLLCLKTSSTPEPVQADSALDQDARMVMLLRKTLASRGMTDPERVFLELSRQRPEWTRERWTRANEQLFKRT